MHRSRGIHTCTYIDTHPENDHPRPRWSLASTQERKRTRLNPAVYIWKCVSSLLSLLSFVFPLSSFVTQSIAYDRNRNVKFFDPSRDTPIFHSCPKNASHPFSREKSYISLSEIYRMFLQKFRDLGRIVRIAKKRNCWFLFCFFSCRKLARFINFKIIRLKIINL